MKKIPYGIANFEAIKENNGYYYVDKTEYIETMESLGGKYLFFLRPRRFGKSLFLSMLEHYYDIKRRGQFEELFHDTYIGKNPTPLRNSFPVLKLNFSGLPTHGTSDDIEFSFNLKIRANINSFYEKYSKILGFENDFQEKFKDIRSAGDILNFFIEVMYDKNIKYYLLIDEYDNFANNILIHHGKEKYLRVTHQSGFLRSFFAAIKNATETRTVERMFVTGVSPLVLSDVTSGMNIGDNLTNEALFNSAIGFSQAEVDEMLEYHIGQGMIPENERDEILEILRVNYNNYCFSRGGDRVYNSDMVLFFFNKYSQGKEIPNNLIDPNVRTDYGKLKFLILQDKKLNGNFSILNELIKNQEIETELVQSFSLEEMIDKDKFKSFLYYLGLLTIKSYRYGLKYILNIPNEVVKTMHFEYLRGALKDRYDLDIDVDFLRNEFDSLAFEGRWDNLFTYILDKFYEASSIRDFIYREEGIKMFMLAYLNVTPLYFVETEPEMNKGYADIFLRKNYFTTDMTKFEYLIELKYIKSDEAALITKNSSKFDSVKADAVSKLDQYSKSRNITCELKKIVVICSSKEVLLVEEV